MDMWLLSFVNQTMAHPVWDGLMIGLTIVGFALLPVLGAALLFSEKQRRTGITILVTLVATFIVTLLFQYLALRPRPEAVRLLLPTPNFPAFPSGHAACTFGVAVVVGLSYRRRHWWAAAVSGAALIAVSRVYLGHHYPSDVFGGAVLGAAVGAACYGVIGKPRADWRWLLWPQVAIVIIVSQMAYLGILPFYLLTWPFADKVMHFLLFGAVVFWLNLWYRGRTVRLWVWAIPLAILLPLSIALVEEGIQAFSPLRRADITDLTSDLAGMLFFFWLSGKFIQSALPVRINAAMK